MTIFANKEILARLWLSMDISVTARFGKFWQISARKWGCLGLALSHDFFLFFWCWSFSLWVRENYFAARKGEQSQRWIPETSPRLSNTTGSSCIFGLWSFSCSDALAPVFFPMHLLEVMTLVSVSRMKCTPAGLPCGLTVPNICLNHQ